MKKTFIILGALAVIAAGIGTVDDFTAKIITGNFFVGNGNSLTNSLGASLAADTNSLASLRQAAVIAAASSGGGTVPSGLVTNNGTANITNNQNYLSSGSVLATNVIGQTIIGNGGLGIPSFRTLNSVFNVTSNGIVTGYSFNTDGSLSYLNNDGSGSFAGNAFFWDSSGNGSIKSLAASNNISLVTGGVRQTNATATNVFAGFNSFRSYSLTNNTNAILAVGSMTTNVIYYQQSNSVAFTYFTTNGIDRVIYVGTSGGGNSGGTTNIIPFFNVKTYGAIGNGVVNDFVSFSNCLSAVKVNGGGTLYIPAGFYNLGTNALLAKSLVVQTNMSIVGDGMGHYGDVTTLLVNTTNLPLFLITNSWCHIAGLKIFNVNTNAGVALVTEDADVIGRGRLDCQDVSFYNGSLSLQNNDTGQIIGCDFLGFNGGQNPFTASIYLSNHANPDDGDNLISGCLFGQQGAFFGMLITSSGGTRITDCKFQGSSYQVYVTPIGGSTSILNVENCSFENFTTGGIVSSAGDGSEYYGFNIHGCEFLSLSSGAYDIQLNAGIGNHSTIADITDLGATTQVVRATNITNLSVVNIVSKNGSTPVLNNGGCVNLKYWNVNQ